MLPVEVYLVPKCSDVYLVMSTRLHTSVEPQYVLACA